MRKSATILAIFILAATAHAEPRKKGDAYQQAPAPGDGDRTVFATANSASTALFDTNGATAGGTIDLCIPWGEMVTLKAKTGEIIATITMGQTVDLPVNVDTTGACYVSDPDVAATSGRGSCVALADGERRTIVVDFDAVYQSPGARSSRCSAPVTVLGLGRRPAFPPCFDDADCTAAGSTGTCVASSVDELRRTSCAFIVAQGDTTNTSLTVASGK